MAASINRCRIYRYFVNRYYLYILFIDIYMMLPAACVCRGQAAVDWRDALGGRVCLAVYVEIVGHVDVG